MKRGLEGPVRLRDERVDLSPVADVGPYRNRPSGMRTGQMFCCLTALVVVDHDSGTLAEERLGDAAAEPTTTAGHHDNLLGDHGTRDVGISRTGCGCHPNTPLLVTKEL